MDKYTFRGLVYGGVSVLLAGYELAFADSPRAFLLFMYAAVLLISIGLIFFFHDDDDEELTK